MQFSGIFSKSLYKVAFIALCLFTAQLQFGVNDAYAKKKKKKMSKNEKAKVKALKKKMKKMDPLKFKEIYTEYQELNGQKPALKRTAEQTSSELVKLKAQLKKYDADIASTKAKVSDLTAKIDSSQQGVVDYSSGMVIKVQIGQIGGYDIPKDILGEEVDKGDGKIKYTLGYFKVNNRQDKEEYESVYQEAEAFKVFLRNVGVKHATVVVYVDNEKANQH